MKGFVFSLLAAGAAIVSANPAGAAAPTSCDASGSVATLSNLSVTGGTVVGVCGFFDKNVVGDSDYIGFALDQLGLANYGGAPIATVASGYGADGQDFLKALGVDVLYGDIYVAFHTGKGADWGNSTAFFHIVADAGGVTSIVPNTNGKGLSNGALFAAGASGQGLSSSVPEPATWAMMLMGFGLVGAGLRGRRGTAARVLA